MVPLRPINSLVNVKIMCSPTPSLCGPEAQEVYSQPNVQLQSATPKLLPSFRSFSSPGGRSGAGVRKREPTDRRRALAIALQGCDLLYLRLRVWVGVFSPLCWVSFVVWRG
ncbi:hypothetical protein BS78_06G221000 [Paspalum vaginatum]|nr:hypothetical protein BS78_06G221000 [Paspalum vaginatum]